MKSAIWISIAIGVSLGGAITSAAAQEKNANLREALQAAPEQALAEKSPIVVTFVDLDVLRQIGGGELDRETMIARGYLGGDLRPYAALGAAGPQQWSKNAGVNIAKVRYLAGFMSPPNSVNVWGLAADADAAAALDAFGKQGAKPVDGIEGGLANGAPHALDLVNRDPQNPWRGPMGQTSVAAQRGNILLQASGPDPLRATLSAKRSLADNAAVDAAVAGAEAAGGAIAQATLYSPLLGLESIDPALVIMGETGDMAATKSAFEKATAEAGQGIPLYFAAIVADVQTADGPALTISLAYPDCKIAETAAAQVTERWNKSEFAKLASEPKIATAPGKDGMCAAVAVIGSAEKAETNKVAAAAFTGVVRRDFTVLQIGAAPAK